MERDEILKSAGFSESFLEALHAFEKSVPEIHYDAPMDVTDQIVNVDSTSQDVTVTSVNDDYFHNLIVKQG